MSRPLRIHAPGLPYHVMSRGNGKQCIFEDDDDHLRFLRWLAYTLDRFQIMCVAYCLMWNHFHLLVIPGEHTVSRLMQHLNGAYCGEFNRRHKRVGHVLQGRPPMKIVDSHAYFLTALRYILRNPVTAQRAATAGDWRWSSCRAMLGLEPCPPFLSFEPIWQAFDAPDVTIGRERILRFLEVENPGQPFLELENSLLAGGEGVARRVDPLLPANRKVAEYTYEERYATRPRLEAFFDDAKEPTDFEDGAREAFCAHAYTLRQIGEVLGKPSGTIWLWIQRSASRAGDTPRGARSPRRVRELLPARRGQTSIFE